MYLHLGQSIVVPEASVIGVFDLDNTTASRITRKFLSQAEEAGRVISVSTELPKSFVVCSEGSEHKIYLSQLSSQTLLKRFGWASLQPKLRIVSEGKINI